MGEGRLLLDQAKLCGNEQKAEEGLGLQMYSGPVIWQAEDFEAATFWEEDNLLQSAVKRMLLRTLALQPIIPINWARRLQTQSISGCQ